MMTLSHPEIIKKAGELGISRAEATRIANNWFGAPAPSKIHEQMAWQSLFINTAAEEGEIFRSKQFLLHQAKFQRVKKKRNRVTDFSGWVFDLCFPGRPRNALALKMGKETEERLLQRHRARSLLPLPEPTPQTRDWEIVFRDPLTDVTPFRISSLTVNGGALYGVPDIVYRNRKTGEIMIVEIKASAAEVPVDGWPNLRAQLWCYSKIDRWVDAPKIRLVGQVWSPGGTTLRRTFTWLPDAEKLNEECTKLFGCYQEKAMSLPYNH